MTILRVREFMGLWFVCTAEPSACHWPSLYRSARREAAERYARAVVASQPLKYRMEG
jgi:hypothetical protein